MELRVHKVNQLASGGSHVTSYDADVELVAGGSDVQVLGTAPSDADPDDYRRAVEAIRRGAEQVLRPLALGAVLRIRRMLLHPVDFKDYMFERLTAEELRRLMDQRSA